MQALRYAPLLLVMVAVLVVALAGVENDILLAWNKFSPLPAWNKF